MSETCGKRKALIPLSGDPIHFGHIDFIENAAKKYDEVIVGFGINPGKNYLFPVEERADMAKRVLSHLGNVSIVSFPGMTVDYAYENCAESIVKGVRDSFDLEYEKQLEKVGDSQELNIRTELVESKPELAHISSSNVKAIVSAQGMANKYVPLYVKQRLEAKMLGQYVIGITGEPGSGKSHVGKKLKEMALERKIPCFSIEFDKVGHDILNSLTEPAYEKVRQEIAACFGKGVLDENGMVSRKALGDIVFCDQKKLDRLNEIMYTPLRVRLRRELMGRKGLIIINAALIAEADIGHFCNNNVVLVNADRAVQKKRLEERGLNGEQIKRRLESQYSYGKKLRTLEAQVKRDGHGSIWKIENSEDENSDDLETALDRIISEMDIYGELRFHALWQRINADGAPDEEYKKLESSYSGNTRFYHSLSHIVSGLGEFEQAKQFMKSPEQVLFALYYHDYVMKRGSVLDEELSAQYAYNLCKQATLSEEFAENVRQLILSTKGHEPLTEDAKWLIDIDLSILGKSEAEFGKYEDEIAKEWSWVPKDEFKEGRKKVLEKFIERENIYLTDHFRKKYELTARKNIEGSIEKLK